ncbi:MAG TPA: D-alanine--D-alanine ligase family protein [Chloroflexota bacterium]|jgi:D-alanine-D-alanine ligase|nr:D-alanine--D-alanine ligase family protein [Chloroflexota bacterium]
MAGRRLRVLVVFGGRSGEHEVSLQSARAVMAALDSAGYEVVPLGITRSGRWLVGGDPLHALSSGESGGEQAVSMLPEPGRTGLVALPECEDGLQPIGGGSPIGSVDVVFPVLHGTFGEDGTVQGLFELAAMPYAGAGVLGSSLGMDKVIQKTLWRGMGLPVVDFLTVSRREWERDPEDVLNRIEAGLSYPCFTKPANLGSSVGVSKARTRAELSEGLAMAARYDAKLLVEQGIDARELEVGVLGNDEPTTSVVGEILPGADFYSYEAKYLDSGSQALIPADIEPNISGEVRRIAIEAFKGIDASGLARVDFFLDRNSGKLYLNEINTMPGFTEISMYPKLWAATGVSFPELVRRIAELAIERFQERVRNQTSRSAE